VSPRTPALKVSRDATRLLGNGVTVAAILLGAAHPVHILTRSATVRRIVNMTALAVGSAARDTAANAEMQPAV
jgi:phosphotransacetylase